MTGNETNNERVFGSANELRQGQHRPGRGAGRRHAVDPSGAGTKGALRHRLMIQADGSATLGLRLTDTERVKPGRADSEPTARSPASTS